MKQKQDTRLLTKRNGYAEWLENSKRSLILGFLLLVFVFLLNPLFQ